MSDQAGTKVCPHCKKEVDKDASRCPHCQGKMYVWTTGRKMLAGLLGFIVLYIAIVSSSGNSSTPTAEVPKQIGIYDLCVDAEVMVKEMLKSPSTAEFPTCNTQNFSIEKLGENYYLVSSYVDSQNGFGAMIRSDWSVKYRYLDDKKNVDIEKLIIGDEVYNKK
jgi:hypothetical protein